MIRIFTQNSFQSISVIFCLLALDVLKIAFSTIDRPFVNLGIGTSALELELEMELELELILQTPLFPVP